jgi:hypothetical protein
MTDDAASTRQALNVLQVQRELVRRGRDRRLKRAVGA